MQRAGLQRLGLRLGVWGLGVCALSAAGCGGEDASFASSACGSCASCEPCTRLSIQPKASYRVEANGEEALICYGFESPALAKRHIVGFAAKLDNAAVVHHMTLLQADSAVPAAAAPCDAGAMGRWRSLYGWAPGAEPFELPPEAGFVDEPGAHFVVQLHYLNTTTEPVLDASGFELTLATELRPNDADIMAFGTHEIRIEAQSSARRDCSVLVPEGGATTQLFAAFPHMHRLGESMRVEAHRPSAGPGAVPADLGSAPDWDFDRQGWLPLDYQLRPGDVVRSVCEWKNDGASVVGFGSSTQDEMCYSFTMYYPRIEDPAWHWSLPALYSQCEAGDLGGAD